MNKVEIATKRRQRRKRVIRKKIFGTKEIPRLSVFKSNKYIYVQAIDDTTGTTIASASSVSTDNKNAKLNKKTAELVGTKIAEELKKKKIEQVVFDRNGYLFTGRIKALADNARKAGLKF